MFDIQVAGTTVRCRQDVLQGGLAALARHPPAIVDRPLVPFVWVIDWCKSQGMLPVPQNPEFRQSVLVEANYWVIEPLVQQIEKYNRLRGISPFFTDNDLYRANMWMQHRTHMHVQCVAAGRDGFRLMAT